MIDVDTLFAETAAALGADEACVSHAFIEKWIPEITNEIQALREQVFLLNLQLTEACSEKEED